MMRLVQLVLHYSQGAQLIGVTQRSLGLALPLDVPGCRSFRGDNDPTYLRFVGTK